MIALFSLWYRVMSLWHRVMAAEHHRRGAEDLIDRLVAHIEALRMPGSAVALLADTPNPWTKHELLKLLDRRDHELRSGEGPPLRSKLAALLLTAGSRLWGEGRTADVDGLAKAAETAAGDDTVVATERAALDGAAPRPDPHEFLLTPARASTIDDTAPEPFDEPSDRGEDEA